MLREEDVIFGKIALELNLVTPEQLEEGLSLQERYFPPLVLGEALRRKGFLNRKQITLVLSVQQRRLSCREISRRHHQEELKFGSLAIHRGLVTPAQLEQALRIQQEQMERDRYFHLGRVFFKLGILSFREVRSVLALQRKSLMSCPQCRNQFNVVGYRKSRHYRCTNCGTHLVTSRRFSDDYINDTIT